MIIGEHNEFIGVKKQAIISSDDFVYFPEDYIEFFELFLSFELGFDIQAQAPWFLSLYFKLFQNNSYILN